MAGFTSSINYLAGNFHFLYIVGMNPPNFKESKAVIYAPLAGISDSPSRKIARRFGADITVSELISAEGVIRNGKGTLDLARFDDDERPFGLQLFGNNPESMALAAKRLSELDPDFIDINFGCPARKIVSKNGGSSILKDLKLMEMIISKMVNTINIPVTVKIRSGWKEKTPVYLEAGRIIQDCGASAVTLHPRYTTQGFDGKADWSQISEMKQALAIPVIGNGDISTPEDAKRMFDQTGCDAIMIGRASIGNPWIFQGVKEYLSAGNILPPPTARQRIELALEHLKMNIDYYGLPAGIYKMRSRFCWYIKGLPEASRIRGRLVRMESQSEIRDLLYKYLEEMEDQYDSRDKAIAAGFPD
jgi:nifR3 family TIM-barrel protein